MHNNYKDILNSTILQVQHKFINGDFILPRSSEKVPKLFGASIEAICFK